MPSIANITAFGGESTPISHTFTAEEIEKTVSAWVAKWKEVSLTTPEYALTRVTARITTSKEGVKRIAVRVSLPVMESVSGQNSSGYTAPAKVAYEETAEFVMYAHPRSTVANRRLVRQMLVNIVGNVQTSVAADTGGQLTQLFDQQIKPT